MSYWEKHQAEHKAHQEWLASLKVGDQVVTEYSRYSGRFQILTIERFTQTQGVCQSGVRFRREDGRLVGTGYGSITPVTNEVLEANELSRLQEWLLRISHHKEIRNHELAKLRAMKKTYDEFKK